MASGIAAEKGAERFVRRPPSVPEHLWEAIPSDLRMEFVEAAAAGLRRGIHPMESVSRMLKDRGIDKPVPKAPPVKRPGIAPRQGGRPPSLAVAVPAAEISAAKPRVGVPSPVPAPRKSLKSLSATGSTASEAAGSARREVADVSIELPTVRYGNASHLVAGAAPMSVVGRRIHEAMRLPGSPGAAAAEAEVSVFKAIARDPVMAFSDPAGIAYIGARLPREAAIAIASMTRKIAERAIDDVRKRKAAGDREAQSFIDPDDWSLQHEDDEPAATAMRR